MDIINDLESELAVAILLERGHQPLFDTRKAVLLIGEVENALSGLLTPGSRNISAVQIDLARPAVYH